jgi:hypothetical protein
MMVNRILGVAILAIACSCASSQESRQLADDAAVTFLGLNSGSSFQVDDSELMPIGQVDTRFVIDAGPHLIRVYHEGTLIAQEKIYASPGQTVEVRVR